MQTNDMEIEVLSAEEKRELRRNRRLRNQRNAIIGLIVIILVLAGVVVGGIFVINQQVEWKKQQKEIEEQLAVLENEGNAEDASILSGETEGKNTEGASGEGDNLQEEENAKVLDEVVEAIISEMTLEEKVAGLFVVTPEGITGVNTAVQAGNGTKEALEKYPVGGIIYYQKNIQSEEQMKAMIENTVSYCKYPMFIGVDEEGGEVSRLAKALKLDNVGPMADIGSTGDTTKAYEAMKTVGSYMTSYGFNLNFAPVADILYEGNLASLGNRAFGSDGAVVAGMVTAAMKGLEESGVTACVKHFPGVGDVSEDTQNGLAVVDKSLEEMKQTDLLPFISAIENGVDMIMVGHVSLPQMIEDNIPATMSEEVMSDLLRSELGFNGVIITDAMNTSAITGYYSADEAAIRALKAGADMVLMPENFEVAYNGVIEAVKDGTISEDRINNSLKRVFRIKYADSVGE